eukprot:TRINITY_DN10053_c0_g1_i1.p2 TRINITY_DN10053_c0_g1~~TRINITY_DN10053_c0_g1_i1.p2  ORF type:complete len:209 (-),score=-7.99 TRINITY_DN10053_c0_g1_i1:509-1135(-)
MSNKRQKNTFNETNYYSNLFYLLTKSTRSKLKQYLNCANQINNILALFPLIIIFKTFGIFQCNLFHPCQVTKLISINMERTLAQIPENLQIVFGTFTLQFTIQIITNQKKELNQNIKTKRQIFLFQQKTRWNFQPRASIQNFQSKTNKINNNKNKYLGLRCNIQVKILYTIYTQKQQTQTSIIQTKVVHILTASLKNKIRAAKFYKLL